VLITDEVRSLTRTTRWLVMAARRRALTRLSLRLRPTEWIFAGLGVLMVTLIIYTGQFSALAARYLVTLKFALVISSVATAMFLRVYCWPTVAERAGSALGRRGARIRYAWRTAARSLREFSPVFGLLAIYEVLHLLTPILAPQVHDAALIRIDHAVLGVDVGRWLDDHLGSSFMTMVMTYCYISYAFASPIYAGVLYLRREYRAFHDFALAIAITALLGYSGYLLVPAIGPYLYQAELYPDQLPGWGYGGILDLIANAKGAARDAFPSLHTAMTTVLLGSMWRDARRLFWTYLPVGLGLYVATMYLRVHYAVDVAAGFAVAAIALAVAPKINQYYARMCDRHSVTDPTPSATKTQPGLARNGVTDLV
jgi:membrane-associated phospholipid phosphatase